MTNTPITNTPATNTPTTSTPAASTQPQEVPGQTLMKQRFRGYFPVVIDIETGGFNSATDAMLELAMITLEFTQDGLLQPSTTYHHHILPFEGAHLCPKSLEFTGIDPLNPLRGAVEEKQALQDCFKPIKAHMKEAQCNRAIIVAHNAHFDHGFLKAAISRAAIKRDPFHPFSSLDTATLSAIFFGQTVLAKACKAADIDFSGQEAHSALYDAQKTAALFCTIVNRYQTLGGWSF